MSALAGDRTVLQATGLARLIGRRGAFVDHWAPPLTTLGRCVRDERGVAAVLTAAAAASLLGIAGLTIDVGGWYLLRRNMQAAVDAAALVAAASLDASASATSAEAVARSVTSRNGFTAGSGGTAVTVVPDPGTGRVAVTVERPSNSVLLSAAGFMDAGKTVRARAVARVVDAGAPPCVHATAGSVAVGNNVDITAGCAVASDSAAPDAFKVGSGGSVANGSGRITVTNIVTHGGCEGCAQALGSKLTLTRSPVPTTYAPKTTNPYEALSNWSPPPSAVSNQSCSSMPSGSAVTLAPGCFTSITAGSNNTVNLQPGVYYIRGGDLDVRGTLTCTACAGDRGVSLVLVGSGNAAPGKVDINAQAHVDLNAGRQAAQPLLDGVLLYRHAPNAQPNQSGKGEIDINGGANVRVNGAIVAPTSWVTMGGSGATDPESCTVFVVHSMEFRGNANLGVAGCGLYGTQTGVLRIPRLVE
jgi:Flp pilus assembly protein TadG